MGHCTHFLTRLDRVSMKHADMALELYRNPKLVQAIVGEFADLEMDVGRPDRVAIALGDDGEGPYVVVGTDGGFITCLGKQMKPRGLFVIRREVLDSRARLLERYREGWERLHALDGYGDAGALLMKLGRGAQRVSREDVEQLAPILPAFQFEVIKAYYSAARSLRDHRDEFVDSVYVLRNHRRGARKKLRQNGYASLWQNAWLVGNCHTVLAMQDVEQLTPLNSSNLPDVLLNYHVFGIGEGLVSLALRCLWAAGKRGATLIETMRLHHEHCDRPEELFGVVASLTMAALRHRSLEREALAVADELVAHYDSDPALAAHVAVMRRVLERRDAPPTADQLRIGRQQYVAYRRKLGPAHPDFEAEPEEAPEGLLLLLGAHIHDEFRNHPRMMVYLLECLPWLARLEALDVFLPRRIVDALDHPPDHVWGERLVARHVALTPHYGVAPRVVGRNDPCPCRSGKKYRQCCEAEECERFAVS